MGIREVWRNHDFRRLYATRLTSQFSDGLIQVALGGELFFSPEKQTSAAKAATAFAVLLLPYSLLGPFAGVFIDRWRRRQILVYTPLVRALCVLVMIWLISHDNDLFLLAALVALGVNRFFLAALPASLPHVVTEKNLLLANTVSVTSGTIAAFLGAAAGFLTGGTLPSMATATCLYVATSLVARTLHPDLLGPDEVPRETVRNVIKGMIAGVRHVAERRPAALALGAISLYRFVYGLWLIMTLLLYRNHFPSGFDGLAVITAVSGAGYLLGALITPAAVRRVGKDLWITILFAVASAGLLLLATPFRQTLYVAGGFVLGVAAQGIKICVDTIVQQQVADEFRGRVFSAYDMLFNAVFVAAAAVAALALPPTGRSYPVLGFAICAYAAMSAAYLYLTRAYERRGSESLTGPDQPKT
ncbi:MFS transporter [Actinocorallia longicatena]|uniref:MFS transporter n=1 Tax=Actinocorallia longicatena TaxID=111803 RepID=UPI0031E34FE7